MLTIALSKGRILDDTLPLLAEAGIVPTENPDKSRKLIIPTTQDDVRLLIVRATDVPTYVEHGAADLGVAGKDVLMEYGGQGLYEPLDLQIAQCKLMTAGKVGAVEPKGRLRIAHQVRQCCQALLRRTGSSGRYHQALRFDGAGAADRSGGQDHRRGRHR
ncbi:UNVERIFIED_ORG: ATP phosphoribosyltransferase [Pseudomonas reinekei]|nr:ATP phosphoribosyltransferase [Pseudomonas reinekei]